MNEHDVVNASKQAEEVFGQQPSTQTVRLQAIRDRAVEWKTLDTGPLRSNTGQLNKRLTALNDEIGNVSQQTKRLGHSDTNASLQDGEWQAVTRVKQTSQNSQQGKCLW